MTDTIETQITGTPGWWLDRLSRRLTERVRSQRICEDYYHGEHRLSYATRKLLEAFGETFRYLRVNYCGVVVDALAERLEVQGFRFADDQGAADAAWAIWQRNGMDARFAHGLREGLIKGESSLGVWVDEGGEPTLSVEDPFEVIVATDPASRTRRAALKRWQDADTHRTFATVYLPHATFKYQSQAIVTASIEQLAPVILNIPGKGLLFQEPLARVGSAERTQIYAEIGLEYGHEAAHGEITSMAGQAQA